MLNLLVLIKPIFDFLDNNISGTIIFILLIFGIIFRYLIEIIVMDYKLNKKNMELN